MPADPSVKRGTAATVELGALAPSLIEQGFLDPTGLNQRTADSITFLRIRGYLTRSEATTAERRLVKSLVRASKDTSPSTTTVINVKKAPKGWRDDPMFVDVRRMRNGQINPTPGKVGYFGNPYKLVERSDEVEAATARAAAVGMFRAYAEYKMARDPAYRAAVKGLAGKTLVCCCKPLMCHGDVLAELADGLAAGVHETTEEGA